MNTRSRIFVMETENDKGFSLIEILVAISVFSIGFMALSATIWSSSQTRRTTAFADNAVLACQDTVEQLTAIPINNSMLTAESHEQDSDSGGKISYRVMAENDVDGDGIPDFKTIAIEVFNQGELKMKSYYRRKIN